VALTRRALKRLGFDIDLKLHGAATEITAFQMAAPTLFR
jgi:hypothetical protein